MKNTIRTVLFALSLIVAFQVPVKAEPLSDQLQIQKKQLEDDKNALKSAEDKREEIEAHIEHIDNQIVGYMKSLEDNKKQITQKEKDIKQAEDDVVKAENDVKTQQELLSKRVRAIYKNGQSSYISMLLQAEDFTDLMSRIESIKRIVDFDKKLINTLEIKKAEVENKKTVLHEEKDKLLALKSDNEKKLTALNNDVETQKKLIEEAKAQEKQYAAKVNQAQSLVNATIAQINSIRASAPKYDVSRGAAPITTNNIIAYASNFLGTPYLWGGTSPSTGFDCSGFTQYVFRHFGIGLGRTTYDQINEGFAVSRDQLQPGDLVFFGTWIDPHHMGIYAGNNTYIHAPRTGDVVKVSPITRSDYITARRVTR